MKNILTLIAAAFIAFASGAQCPVSLKAKITASPVQPLAGFELHTVYLGYPGSAQTINLTATTDSGSAPFTYLWNRTACNGTTLFMTPTPGNVETFSPTGADICAGNGDNIYKYAVTITDANGCTATATTRVNAVDVFTGSLVNVFHKVGPQRGAVNYQPLLLPFGSTLNMHIYHGDPIGNTTNFTP